MSEMKHTLIAYHGNPKIKEKYLKRVKAHAKADRLIQGIGWENGKGCAVGCTLEAYDHAAYETELGIPGGHLVGCFAVDAANLIARAKGEEVRS